MGVILMILALIGVILVWAACLNASVKAEIEERRRWNRELRD